MTASLPSYRTLRRPGPGLALIAEPDGRVALWTLNYRANPATIRTQCGAPAGRHYRPSIARVKDSPRLCRLCVEGTVMTQRVPGGNGATGDCIITRVWLLARSARLP